MAWEELLAIAENARTDLEAERAEPPTTCPNDGEVLKTGPFGGLYCPFDGWKPSS